jgi:hypothetical protein
MLKPFGRNDLSENLAAVNKVNCIYLGNSSNDSSHVFQGFVMLMVKLQQVCN